MLDITHSPEVMAAYSEIELAHIGIKKISLSPLSVSERVKETITIVKTIIQNKKIIQADFSNDEKLLNELLKMYDI